MPATKYSFYISCLLITLFVVLSVGCGGGSDGDGKTTIIQLREIPDEVKNVATGSYVVLDGSDHAEKGGSEINYHWIVIKLPDGSQATLEESEKNTVNPSFIPDVDGTYEFILEISADNNGQPVTTSQIIQVIASSGNVVPMANPGLEFEVRLNSSIQLDASLSDDANGDELSYQWSIVTSPAGSAPTLSSTSDVQPTLEVDIAGEYEIELIVSDGEHNSNPRKLLITVTESNTRPIAVAGHDIYAQTNATVNLDGSLSRDAENDSLAYSWYFTSKPDSSSVSLSNSDSANPSFAPDVEGAYVISLRVSDGTERADNNTKRTSDIDNVLVIVTSGDNAPVANAGLDQDATTGDQVILNGISSYDLDDNTLTYSWTMSQLPDGSNASLADADKVKSSFTPDVDGDYIIQLIVNDGSNDSEADTVTITAITPNRKPVADPGSYAQVIINTIVQLDGSSSSDVEGDDLSYSWSLSKPNGSSAELSATDGVNITFTPDVVGEYQVSLTVNDGTEDSEAVTVSITAIAPNQPPIANAGPNQPNIILGETVTLNGSESVDNDGDEITYLWSFVSGPEDITDLISDVTAVGPTFTPVVAGVYELSLVVNDQQQDSTSDTVLITVTGAVGSGNAPVITFVDSLEKGLVAYYPFNGNANDESGNGNDGVVNGATLTEDRDGNVDSAYSFDGVDDYIALPDGKDLINIDFTIYAWLKPINFGVISSTGPSCASAIFDYFYHGGSIQNTNNSGISVMFGRDQNCTDNSYLTASFVDIDMKFSHIREKIDTEVYRDRWSLISIIRSGSEFVYYYNGVEYARKEVSSKEVHENANESFITLGAMRREISGGFFFPFNGYLDDVRIYNRSVSASDIKKLVDNATLIPSTPNDELSLCVNATDEEDGVLTLDAIEWQSDLDGSLGTGECITTKLSAGDHVISVTATDSDSNSTINTNNIHINAIPEATITSPENKTEFASAAIIDFQGMATDAEDGDLSGETLVWSSSIDGVLEQTGESITATLSDGRHVITLTATDSDGAVNTNQISICVELCSNTVFYEDFETGLGDWWVDNGVWEIGVPTSGPSSSQSGEQVAGTILGSTNPSTDSRLISKSIVLPDILSNQNITLRFWHWFSFGAWDVGNVQVSVQTEPGVWSEWNTLDYYMGNSSSVWTRPSIDLSIYAGKKIRIAFLNDDNDCCGNSSGWYVDDLSIDVMDNVVNILPYLEDFEKGLDDWAATNGTWQVGAPTSGPNEAYAGSNVAATILDDNYQSYDSRFKERHFVSPAIQLPELSASQVIQLRFWHWFSFGAWDTGKIQVSTQSDAGEWNDWETLDEYMGNSNNVWTRPNLDLTDYANKKIRIALWFDENDCCGNSSGWYLDDLSIDVVDNVVSTLPYFEDFEGGLGDWAATNGTWQVGVPTSGPNKAYAGSNVAATILDGNYQSYDSRFKERHFIGHEIQLPEITNNEEIHFRFWHWFSFGAYDFGNIQIMEQNLAGEWGEWITKGSYDGSSNGVWTKPLIDLSAHAGKKVRIAFWFDENDCCGNSSGWYVDNISISIENF